MANRTYVFMLLVPLILVTWMIPVTQDEATHDHMRQLHERQRQEMEETCKKQSTLEQSEAFWGALPFAASEHWQLQVVAEVSFILFQLCWWLTKTRCEPGDSYNKDSCSSKKGKDEEEEKEEEEKEEEKEQEQDKQQQEDEESKGEGHKDVGDMDRIYERRIQWPGQKLLHTSREVMEVVNNLLSAIQEHFLSSSFQVLKTAIGVDSAFEGWSPHGNDTVYHVLVPLQPPCGYAFLLDVGKPWEVPPKDPRICVRLECTCKMDQLQENTLCCCCHRNEELRQEQGPSLLDTLCTDSLLDAHKTAAWFQTLVTSAWRTLPQSCRYDMKLLPSGRACRLQLTKANSSPLTIEIMFGVQQGDSDIFLSSENIKRTPIPNTRWLVTYAVAEAKFFTHTSMWLPRGSCHLKCLYMCARILLGTGLSTYAVKTVTMRLLTTIPQSSWHRAEFLPRLEDAMRHLRCCVEEKHLDHFFTGNYSVPAEVALPKEFEFSQPFNILHKLVRDPERHKKALLAVEHLQNQLVRLLFYGH